MDVGASAEMVGESPQVGMGSGEASTKMTMPIDLTQFSQWLMDQQGNW